MSCPHEKFNVRAHVELYHRSPGIPPYRRELQVLEIVCIQCGLPFAIDHYTNKFDILPAQQVKQEVKSEPNPWESLR